jgi:hypothetical protein
MSFFYFTLLYYFFGHYAVLYPFNIKRPVPLEDILCLFSSLYLSPYEVFFALWHYAVHCLGHYQSFLSETLCSLASYACDTMQSPCLLWRIISIDFLSTLEIVFSAILTCSNFKCINWICFFRCSCCSEPHMWILLATPIQNMAILACHLLTSSLNTLHSHIPGLVSTNMASLIPDHI